MGERDYRSEIEAARHSPIRLRQLAREIQEADGPRILVIRAIARAKEVEERSHPFGRVGAELGLPIPLDQPLYRYKLPTETFARIEQLLSAKLETAEYRAKLAPAFVLWAADWFRRSYRGGMQRWSDIEKVLKVQLPQSEWRNLTDRGFRAWSVEPLLTAHGNQRLSNLARHGGLPAAAIAAGDGWPRRFLERAVGELLGSAEPDLQTAIEACERNEFLLPPTWRSQEMHAVCGELAFRVVELRAFVDKEAPADGRPYSVRLDDLLDDWRDELPMTLDGAAGALINTILEARRLSGSGTIRVGRIMRILGDDWQECLDLHLDGRWNDKDEALSARGFHRVFLLPSDGLADRISGQLAYLEYEAGHAWIARSMRGEDAIEFPFNVPVAAEFHSRGDRLGRSFVLPGGKSVGDGLRVFERRVSADGESHFSLIGQTSGGYRAEQVFIDVPESWALRGKDGKSEIEEQDFGFALGRRLFLCEGEILAEASNGDTFLVRTGQSADRRDRLSIIADSVSGVQEIPNLLLLKHPIRAEVADGLSSRPARRGEVRWRIRGEGSWREDLAQSGPGECEFAWIDSSTGHLRDRFSALVLPEEFSVSQRKVGSFSEISLAGWDGNAFLGNDRNGEARSWKVQADPPKRALISLRLVPPGGSAFELNVQLKSKAWLTTWDGDLLRRDSVVGLADLRDIVARSPWRAPLMGELADHFEGSLRANWEIDEERGLSALRTDIAALMRPLGIDAKVRLDFHNGSNDHWYVTEFGNELEKLTTGGFSPRIGIVGDNVRVCGRFLGAPEKEVDFGAHQGLDNGLGGQAISLPRLRGPWLIYLRENDRVLTRPRFVAGDLVHDVPQHRLGRAMAQPIDLALLDIDALVEEVKVDPTTSDANQTIRVIGDLALSLNGLPPQTFEIFKLLDSAGALSPLLLYRCEEQYLSTILELFDGLCASWVLLPADVWRTAFQCQYQFLLGQLDGSGLDNPEWILARLTEREHEIASRAPQLAPLVCRDFTPLSWDEVLTHFSNHTSEAINEESGGSNPFRPEFSGSLKEVNFAEPLMRVLDAPFVAALSAQGKVELSMKQILTVKDVERRHPDYFARAFGCALLGA